MHFPIVYEYKPDIQGINLENEIRNEPRKLNPHDKKIEIIIPKYAPFFTKSLELTKRDGSPLKPGDDYRIHRIMGGLTERAGQGVGSTIEILNKTLSEVLISYKTLGHFALIDNSVLQTIIDVGEDDRIIHWDDLHGKPVAFSPKLHSHSLNDEITSLGDILDILGDFTKIMQEKMDDRTQTEKVQNYLELLKHYIKVNTEMVRELVTRHENTKNSHGLTKHQIGLSNVENNPTGDFSNIINKDGGYKVKPGDFDAYLNSKLPKGDSRILNGAIPVNQYFSSGELFKSPGYVRGGWIVYVGTDKPVVLGGESKNIEGGSIDLLDLVPNPKDKTFYVYVIEKGKKIVYEISETKYMESNNLLWVGVVKTSDKKIIEVDEFDVFTVDGVRTSRVKRGGAIPASSGSINEEGDLPWLTRAELGLLF